MVSPWPSFEYFKFVAFLGTDRPEASITLVARWFFSMFYLQLLKPMKIQIKNTFLHVYNNCQRQSSIILDCTWHYEYIQKWKFYGNHTYNTVSISNMKQHKHQNDSNISFQYYLHLFLNCVIFNSPPNILKCECSKEPSQWDCSFEHSKHTL